MKLNKSSARGGNSEEIATDVSARVIAMLTDVATHSETGPGPESDAWVSAKLWRDNGDMRRTQAKELGNLNDTKNGTANL